MDRPGDEVYRAAIISEGEDEASRAERFEDTDGEYRELRSRASLGAYLGAASVGNGITPGSPEDELNAALEVRSSGWRRSLSPGRC